MATERRFTFDAVAQLYDDVRPGYPQPLVDDVILLSGIRSGERILEIGCGTGQATAAFANRGFPILCLEPGPSLAGVARRKLTGFTNVDVVTQTFEAWPVEAGAFSLVICAQAFHWLAPDVRFAKAAAALHASGSLAVFGNAIAFESSPLREALDRAYAEHAPSMAGPPSTPWYAQTESMRTLFAESGCFGPVTWRRYPWSQTYTATQYVDLLSTYSEHRLLPPAQRESLLDAIRQAIELHGGGITLHYEAHLYLAQVGAR